MFRLWTRIVSVAALLLFLCAAAGAQRWAFRISTPFASLGTFPEGVMMHFRSGDPWDVDVDLNPTPWHPKRLIATPVFFSTMVGIPWWLFLTAALPMLIPIWFLTRKRKRPASFPVELAAPGNPSPPPPAS
jgi:hypothetical protein